MHIYTSVDKKERHKIIKKAILENDISSQDFFLNILINKGIDITQATLSRDIKELKIVKAPGLNSNYIYQMAETLANNYQDDSALLSTMGFASIEFSGQLAVMKTRPGYAMAIAGEIDRKATKTILGTVAGDDTILIIPKENVTRDEVLKSLVSFIPNIQ